VNISREKPGATLHHYSSPFEKEIGESLQRTLAAPWRLEYPARSVDVLTGTGQMDYTPDFLIANRSTGRAVAVEVKSNLSLSIPNILKLQGAAQHRRLGVVDKDGAMLNASHSAAKSVSPNSIATPG
jgi:hypothetical protein